MAFVRTLLLLSLLAIMSLSVVDAGLTYCPESVGSCADTNDTAVTNGLDVITPAPSSKEACLAACHATANVTACQWDGTICTSHTDVSVVGANSTATNTSCWILSHCKDHSAPIDSNIECNENGFAPTFTYNNTAGKVVNIDVKIGPTGRNASCEATTSVIKNGTSAELSIAEFGGGTEYAYKSGSDIGCNGTFANWNDSNGVEKIKYEVGVAIVLTETIRSIQRKLKYNYQLRCELTRDASTSTSETDSKWTIDNANLEAAAVTKDVMKSFELGTSLKFYKTSAYTTPHDAAFEAKNNDQIYMMVKEENANDLFVFTVEKCWATAGNNAAESDASKKDVFFTNQCQEDSTVTFSHDFDQHWFKLNLLSFYFPAASTESIYFHCTLKICLKTGNCEQKLKSECPAKTRKRRSVAGSIETRTITSEQHIILNSTEIFPPTCASGSVYDRVKKECSNERLLEVKGIYLDIEWNPLYADTSSKVFREFAREKEYQLFAMLQATGRDGVIHGVKVIGATKGSVVIDVQIKYAESTYAAYAFREFEDALLKTKRTTTRVMTILNVRQDKTIEYVPIIVEETPGLSMEKMVLIVVVVVLLFVVSISGITLYKVKQLRRRSPAANPIGFENKGVDA